MEKLSMDWLPSTGHLHPIMYGTGFFLESCVLHEAWVGNGFQCFFTKGLFGGFNLYAAF